MTHAQSLQTIDIMPNTQPTACIIWLHGLGASADDFVPLAKQLPANQRCPIKHVLVQAPEIAVSLNQGYVMPAWFDLKSLEDIQLDDLHGIDDVEASLQLLIKQQIDSGIPAQRIVLAGFSQGASMAIYTALYTPETLAGVISIACCMPNFEQLHDKNKARHRPFSKASLETPFLVLHGEQDNVVPMQMGKQAADALQAHQLTVDFKSIANCDHTINMETLREIDAWLRGILRKTT